MTNRAKYLSLLLGLTTLVINAQQWKSIDMHKQSGNGTISNNILTMNVHDGQIYAGTEEGNVWVSPSGNGGDWKLYGNKMNTPIRDIAVGDSASFIATQPDSLYRLTKSNQWSNTGIPVSEVIIQDLTGYVFVCQDYNGIFRSRDHGQTWSHYLDTSRQENLTGQSGPKGIIPDKRIWYIYSYDSLLYANSKNAVHISKDLGKSWFYRWGDLIIDHGWGSNIRALFMYGYRDTTFLFVSSDGANWNGTAPNLSRSSNLGVHYEASDKGGERTIEGLPYFTGAGLFQDFAYYSPKALFVMNQYDVYVSTDNGIHWSSFNEGLYNWDQKELICDSNRLLLADNGNGIYTYDLTHQGEWSSDYPHIENIRGSSLDLHVKGSAAGEAHYAVREKGASKLTPKQVEWGVNASGGSVDITGHQPIMANNIDTLTIEGLKASTDYVVFTVLSNQIGNRTTVRTDTITTSQPYLATSYQGKGHINLDSGYYTTNDTIQLRATPGDGYRFGYWNINGKQYADSVISVPMLRDIEAKANFVDITEVSIEVIGNGDAYPMGTDFYDVGANLPVNVYPADGYEVYKWEVDTTQWNTTDVFRKITVQPNGQDIKIYIREKKPAELSACDTMQPIDDWKRPGNAWRNGFQSRLHEMYAEPAMNYADNYGYTGTDVGKHYWSQKLAKMAVDTSQTEYYINSVTPALSYHKPGAGSFYYPFTPAGYAMYYFTYKDSILKYTPHQIDTVESTLYDYEEWKYLMRKDHYLDMVYPNGTEFNSENFHWMLRSAGHLFAHEFHLTNGHNNHRLSFRDADSIHRKNVDVLRYFDGFVNNLTRALYNAGRVEWNSDNYWAHTMNALVTLYEGADRCNNPNGATMKKKAKACLDWMMLEAALHYLDGYQVAADARAKGGYINQAPGSISAYTYAYFVDSAHMPSYGQDYWDTYTPDDAVGGFLLNTKYRPPEWIIDIAQKNIALPVEIQSAKPFYHIDFGDYFNKGEAPYHYWKGDSKKSRRFEFETLYLDEHYIMSSIAGGRPSGNLGVFSEQAQWEIGIEGNGNGAMQISGNAADYNYAPAGRCPYHEIGQFRNVMMHLVRKPYSNLFYVLIPDRHNELSESGSADWYKWKGKDLYINWHDSVYMALRQLDATGLSIDTSSNKGDQHTEITWSFADNDLGGVIIEMGQVASYHSFEQFVDSVHTMNISRLNDSTIRYHSASNHSIKMAFTSPVSYKMTENTENTPSINPYSPAANYPELWGDSTYINYEEWDSYHTSLGHLIEQPWGNGRLSYNIHQQEGAVKIDATTAEAHYKQLRESDSAYGTDFRYQEPNRLISDSRMPPDYQIDTVRWDIKTNGFWDETGKSTDFSTKWLDTTGTPIRLQVITDQHCTFETTKTVKVVNDISPVAKRHSAIQVFPNPADKEITILINHPYKGPVQLKLNQVNGQLSRRIQKDKRSEQWNHRINLQELLPGTYILTVKLANEQTTHQVKLVVE